MRSREPAGHAKKLENPHAAARQGIRTSSKRCNSRRIAPSRQISSVVKFDPLGLDQSPCEDESPSGFLYREKHRRVEAHGTRHFEYTFVWAIMGPEAAAETRLVPFIIVPLINQSFTHAAPRPGCPLFSLTLLRSSFTHRAPSTARFRQRRGSEVEVVGERLTLPRVLCPRQGVPSTHRREIRKVAGVGGRQPAGAPGASALAASRSTAWQRRGARLVLGRGARRPESAPSCPGGLHLVHRVSHV